MMKFNFTDEHMDVLRTLSSGMSLTWHPFEIVQNNRYFYQGDTCGDDVPVHVISDLQQWGYVTLATDYEEEATTVHLTALGRDALKYGAGGVA